MAGAGNFRAESERASFQNPAAAWSFKKFALI
jgi:hypothetical protein